MTDDNQTDDSEPHVERLTGEELGWSVDDDMTVIDPIHLTDRIRWREEWTTAPVEEIADLRTYVSDGYLVAISITPGSMDDAALEVDDLGAEASSLSGGDRDRGLLREQLPDAGMYVHPTEPWPLFEPSDRFDFSIPSGVVVEVAPDDLLLTYGVDAAPGGIVGNTLSLPAMDQTMEADDAA